MSLGPVLHSQPNLPPSKNLENLFQQSKKHKCESEEEFKINRLNGYNDDIPHRHKFIDKEKRKGVQYFVWIDKNNIEHHLTYIQSRQIYCYYYEILAKNKPQFLYLKNLIDTGHNLQICGYDAYPLNINEIESAYLDPTTPFGHEKVLFTMLTCTKKKYPWVIHKTLDL